MAGKVVLVSGCMGQAGATLAEQIVARGDKVVGFARRSSSASNWRLAEVWDDPNFEFVEGDVTDLSSISQLVNKYQPDEFYNTAGQSHVHTSFTQPNLTFQVNTVGVLNCLEAIRQYSSKTRLLQYSTSEMFGSNYDIDNDIKYQDEKTKFQPRSPYGCSKVAAHHLVRNYRESYGLFASTIICFNYEGPKRGEQFLTRKVTKWLGENRDILLSSASLKPCLELGNLDAYRDWGHCEDYQKAAQLILNHNKPDDFVVSTGNTYRVGDFVKTAFALAGIENWLRYIYIDEKLKRPAEVDYLCGCSSKIREELGWKPTKTFEQLVKEMVDSDIKRAKLGRS